MPRPDLSPSALRWVARYQFFLIVLAVVELLMWVGYVAVIGTGLDRDNGEGLLLLLIWTAGVGLPAGLVVFLLLAAVSRPGLGLLLGGLAVVPCGGWLVLLAANGFAVGVMRANGVRIGWFGARWSDLPHPDGYTDIGDVDDEGW